MDNLIIFGIGYLVIGALSALIVSFREGCFQKKSGIDVQQSIWTFSEFEGSISVYITLLILIFLFWPIALIFASVVGD